jgi:hypothetical protein
MSTRRDFIKAFAAFAVIPSLLRAAQTLPPTNSVKSDFILLPPSQELLAKLDEEANSLYNGGQVFRIENPEQLKALAEQWKTPGIARISDTIKAIKAEIPKAVPDATRMTEAPTALYLAFPKRKKAQAGSQEIPDGAHPNMFSLRKVSSDLTHAVDGIVISADWLLMANSAGDASFQKQIELGIGHEFGHTVVALNKVLETIPTYQPKTPEFIEQCNAVRTAPFTKQESADAEAFLQEKIKEFPKTSPISLRAYVYETYKTALGDKKVAISLKELWADIIGARLVTCLHGDAVKVQDTDCLSLFSAASDTDVINDPSVHSSAKVRLAEINRASREMLSELSASTNHVQRPPYTAQQPNGFQLRK